MSLGLLLDLSHAGFAAVMDESGSAVRARSTRPAGTRHDDVADWTEALLREAGGRFGDLAWIAVGVGPGSFTGIRIAMAFAQGLALPRGIPVHGFTSFEALHLSIPCAASASSVFAAASAGRSVLAVVPANTGRFYVARSPDDAGALVTGETLAELCAAPGADALMIVTPELTPALDALASSASITAATPGDAWNAVAIARHARTSGRGLARPVYLQLSAAEEKFGAADFDASSAGPVSGEGTP